MKNRKTKRTLLMLAAAVAVMAGLAPGRAEAHTREHVTAYVPSNQVLIATPGFVFYHGDKYRAVREVYYHGGPAYYHPRWHGHHHPGHHYKPQSYKHHHYKHQDHKHDDRGRDDRGRRH